MNNYDDKEDQKEIRQNISNENNENEDYNEVENNIINQMSLEIELLKESLIKSKLNELIEENNNLKLSQVENSKQLSIKDSIIDSD